LTTLGTLSQIDKMGGSSIDIARLINPTRLFADYLQGGLAEYYRYNYTDPQAASSIAAEIDKKSYDRQALYEITKSANSKLGASPETLANIELLKEKNSLCIFAGQQTAFCANPMYVIYKAMTAVKLAKRYSESLGRPVIPCFWMATDDHDFEEVRSANFLLRSGELKRVSYQPANDPQGYPVADIVLDRGVERFCQEVSDALIDTEFKTPLISAFSEYYGQGNKLSEAFAKVLNKYLGGYGIVLVDPNFPGMKAHFKAVFNREIKEHDRSFELFESRSKELTDNGYHAQVHKTRDNLNLFINTPKRKNIILGEGYFSPDGSDDKYSLDQLLEIVESSPERFSTNVLLRPIAQCEAFPTLSHVVGPSELAYFAQIEPLYRMFEVPFPIVYPRAGMTIIEPQVRRIVEKYELDLPDLKNDLEHTLGTIVEKMFPSEAAGDILLLNECVNNDLDKYASRIKDSDPEGHRHIMNFKKHIDFEIKALQKKLKSSNKKRHDDLTEQVRRAYAFLFPDGNLQERVISPLYYANKFGPAIFREIYANLEVDKTVHSVLVL